MDTHDIYTRSQAVSRIADHTASQHLWAHVTSSVTCPFDSSYVISFGTQPLCLIISNDFRDIQRQNNAMVDVTLKQPLNKGQGHSVGTNRFLIYDFL